MRKQGTAVQYAPEYEVCDTFALAMGGGFQDQLTGVVKRLSLDISERAYVALEQIANHRNAMARVRGTLLRRKQTRKSTAEAELERVVDSLMDDLAPMFEVCGPFPPPDAGEDAYADYAKRVDAHAKEIQAAINRREAQRKRADAGK